MLTALLVSTCKFNVGARLPYVLSKSGFTVIAICPETSLICLSQHLKWGLAFRGIISIARLTELMCNVCRNYDVSIVIPCDDLAATCLDVIQAHDDEQPSFGAVKHLVSQWQTGFCPVARTRSHGVELARRLGLKTPRQRPIAPGLTPADLTEFGSPVVIKQDLRDGGHGVWLLPTARDAIDKGQQILAHRPSSDEGSVVAQDFIAGQPVSVSFAAYQGRILDAFTYGTVEQYPPPTGAASVIAPITCPDIVDATRRIVDALGYSGFGGTDFILPPDGGPPVFLELNARPTQTAHLGALFGADLCHAMGCALSGSRYETPCRAVDVQSVALFPSEWARDQNSRYLLHGYHDVPWYEPRIAAAAMSLGGA